MGEDLSEKDTVQKSPSSSAGAPAGVRLSTPGSKQQQIHQLLLDT